ncbi:DUF2024 family protein [Shewanella sp.]|nr:DUF2024 family protein [Shewanella sp.]
MNIDVYDSYATTSKGLMHFDVFVESGTAEDVAFGYGQAWLKSIGENESGLEQSRCNFCHTEIANPNVKQHIEENGHFILKMEGCPVNS